MNVTRAIRAARDGLTAAVVAGLAAAAPTRMVASALTSASGMHPTNVSRATKEW